MTKEELAKHYADRLKLADVKEKEKEAEKILVEISDLVYAESRNAITQQDKLDLVEVVKSKLPMPPKIETGKIQMVWDSDNHQYLRLIEYMMKRIQELKK